MREERTISSQRIYGGRRVNLRVDRVVLPSGRETTREVVEHPDCVVIVALDAQDNVLMVRQLRQAVKQVMLEIPAGCIEPGEKPAQCALRELGEETGRIAGKMEELGGFYSSPGYSTEYMHLFLATELEPGPNTPGEDEIMEVVTIPLNQIPVLISSGEIADAKSIAGLLTLIVSRQEVSE